MLVGVRGPYLLRNPTSQRPTMRAVSRHRTLHIALLIAVLCMMGLLAFGGTDEGVPFTY